MKHKLRGPASGIVLSLLAAMLACSSSQAEGLRFSKDDSVTVTAERAWEADELDVVHFSGGFTLRGPDWSLQGDTAVVYGKLDDPDKVVVKGTPARISFLRQDTTTEAGTEQGTTDKAIEEDRVDGSARVVQYFRATDKLSMEGAATLSRKDSTLVSESIEYDVDTDRYSASGQGGINLLFDPDD